jgi:hypothetical protein
MLQIMKPCPNNRRNLCHVDRLIIPKVTVGVSECDPWGPPESTKYQPIQRRQAFLAAIAPREFHIDLIHFWV